MFTLRKMFSNSLVASAMRQDVNEPAVAKAVFELEKMGMNPVELAVYKGEVKKNMVDAIQIRDAEDRGIQRGLSQGLGRGKEELILRLVRRQFGSEAVSGSVIDRLDRLSPDQLDDLGEALFDFENVADLNAWLSRPN